MAASDDVLNKSILLLTAENENNLFEADLADDLELKFVSGSLTDDDQKTYDKLAHQSEIVSLTRQILQDFQMANNRDYLTIQEAARIKKVSSMRIQEAVSQKQLQVIKLDSQTFVKRDHVQRWQPGQQLPHKQFEQHQWIAAATSRIKSGREEYELVDIKDFEDLDKEKLQAGTRFTLRSGQVLVVIAIDGDVIFGKYES